MRLRREPIITPAEAHPLLTFTDMLPMPWTGGLATRRSSAWRSFDFGNALNDGYIGLGTSLFLQGRIDEAEGAYATALGIKPRSAEALIGLGSVHYSREEYSNAVNYYRSAVLIESRNVNALWGLAISQNELGLGEEALAPLQKIRELVPDSSLAEKAEAMMNAIEQP